jgi:hypothetical protein
MKSEEYAVRYLEKLKNGPISSALDLDPEKKKEGLEFVNKVMIELLNELRQELLKELFDRNLTFKNFTQWNKILPIVRNYNEKCNAIFRKMGMPTIVDLFKHQLEEASPAFLLTWNASPEEVEKLASEAKELSKQISQNSILGKKC